jgi:translation initiation factor 3 subunit D
VLTARGCVAMAFVLPTVHDNEEGWGPVDVPEVFKENPTIYTPFSKSDKLGKAADWQKQEQMQGRYQARYQQFGSNVATAFNWYHVDDEESFQLVAEKPIAKPKLRRFQQRQAQQRGQRGGLQGRAQQQNQPQGKGKKGQNKPSQNKFNFGQSNISLRRSGQTWGDQQRRVRDSSVDIKPDWVVLEQIEFNRLGNLSYEVGEPEDVVLRGSVGQYDKGYDRITAKTEKALHRTDKLFYNVTTTDDPVIRKLAVDGVGNVFATDTILAQLMACPRSAYSWDIVVQRVGTKLFFDKRGSQFDLLTVNETSHDPPLDEKDSINSPWNLSREATYINQNFSQQVLSNSQQPHQFPERNPFHTEGEPALVGYRYRKWKLSDEITLVARCEVDGIIKSEGEDTFLTIKALNEYDPKVTNVDWRQKLDSQRGAVLASELKNNSYKLAKWTVQALLAGSHQIKLGYVARVNPKDNYNHAILGSQTFQPKEFATQINLSTRNMWGILRALIDICMKLPQGRYIFVKDPYKALVRLYEVPPDAFEEADDSAQNKEGERKESAEEKVQDE